MKTFERLFDEFDNKINEFKKLVNFIENENKRLKSEIEQKEKLLKSQGIKITYDLIK
jgi:hypothetical protein